jgi:formylglycine-generating enzyme required for sulfatase activity
MMTCDPSHRSARFRGARLVALVGAALIGPDALAADVERTPPPAVAAVAEAPARAPLMLRLRLAQAAPRDTSPEAFELLFWESIRNSDNPADFRAYLEAYPNGRFAPLARIRAGAAAPSSPPPTPPSDGSQPGPAPPERGVIVDPRPPPQTPSSGQSRAPVSPQVGDVFRDCDGCPEVTVVPAGSFEMGSDTTPFERPRHRVTIARPFAIGRREVTFDEWERCLAALACKHRPSDQGWGQGEQPVLDLSWADAKAYVDWLSGVTGQRYRLPTEAEWEYAARAGTTTAFWWGREPGSGRANCAGCAGGAGGRTVRTGSFPPNRFGLFDTAGNVAEWVEDCWHNNYRGAPADGSAWVESGCRERVLRGGAYGNDPSYVRSASRFKYDVNIRYVGNGFRVVRELP